MKDAYYFSHDANARNDQQILAIRMKYGIRGYGIYFGIIEMLREAKGYELWLNDCSTISYDLREPLEDVQDIVKNFGLFSFDGDAFYSESLKKRMLEMDKKREKRSEAGRIAGLASANKRSTNVKRTSTSKVKESKVKESKENNINTFVHFSDEKFNKAFNDFTDMRIKSRKPFTDRAKELILIKLHKETVENATLMLEQSILKSWLDVFPVKDNRSPIDRMLNEKE